MTPSRFPGLADDYSRAVCLAALESFIALTIERQGCGLIGHKVFVDPTPNPPGAYVEPARLAEANPERS
jgi:hypothetical protein